jgi:hypothetical protein
MFGQMASELMDVLWFFMPLVPIAFVVFFWQRDRAIVREGGAEAEQQSELRRKRQEEMKGAGCEN